MLCVCVCVCVCVCAYVGVGDLPATRPGLLLTDLGPAGKLNGNLASFPGPAVFWGGAWERGYIHIYTEVYILQMVFVLCRYQQMSLGLKNYESHLVER